MSSPLAGTGPTRSRRCGSNARQGGPCLCSVSGMDSRWCSRECTADTRGRTRAQRRREPPDDGFDSSSRRIFQDLHIRAAAGCMEGLDSLSGKSRISATATVSMLSSVATCRIVSAPRVLNSSSKKRSTSCSPQTVGVVRRRTHTYARRQTRRIKGSAKAVSATCIASLQQSRGAHDLRHAKRVAVGFQATAHFHLRENQIWFVRAFSA